MRSVQKVARRSTAPIIPDANFTVANGAGDLSRDAGLDTADARDIQLTVSGRDEPVALILGRNQIGGKWTRALNYGGRLLLPVLWGRGTVDAIESVTMGGNALPATVAVTHYTGAQTTVDPKLVAAFAAINITWSNALNGLAYSVFDLPTQGVDVGDPAAIIRGLRAYDPRVNTQSVSDASTWSYTTNPVLLTARVLTDGKFGLALTPDAEFWASVSIAADRCDEIISGTVKRRTLNYVLQQQASAEEVIKLLGQYCGCWIVPEGASYRFILDAPSSSAASVDESDMIAGSFSYSGKSTLARPNTVFVRYTEPQTTGLWVSRLAPRDADIPALAPGETYRAITVERPGRNSYQEALRDAQELRGHDYLEDISMRWRQTAKALRFQLGDVVNVTMRPVFVAKAMRVMSIAFVAPDRWEIAAQEYDPASYSNSFVTAPTFPDTNLPSPNNPPLASGLVLTEQTAAGTGGVGTSQIVANWTGVNWPFTSGYRVRVLNVSGTIVDEQTVSSTTYNSPPLAAFSTYTVQVFTTSSIAISATSLSGTISLAAAGLSSLVTVFQTALPSTGWTFVSGVETYQRFAGDTTFRIRAASNKTEAAVYPGSNQLTPGRATQLLDAWTQFRAVPPSELPVMAQSPIVDLQKERVAVVALLNATRWLNLYNGRIKVSLYVGTGETPNTNIGYAENATVLAKARWARVVVESNVSTAVSGGLERSTWQLEFDQLVIAALMPSVTDALTANTSATGAVTVQLPRRYHLVTSVQVTPVSNTVTSASYSNLTVSDTLLEGNTLQLHCFDALNNRINVPCSLTITGVAAA